MRSQALVLVFCFVVPRLSAQSGAPPDSGQRVWVRSPKASGALDAGVKGTFEGMTSDSLRVRQAPGGPLVSVGLGPQTRLFVFTGRRSSLGRGAAIGGLGGVLAGAIIGFAGGEDCSGSDWLCFDRGTMALAGAVALGGVGLAGGLIVGALSSHDTWAPTGWRANLHPLVTPVRQGLGLGLSVAF
jgi:hypothetical protein